MKFNISILKELLAAIESGAYDIQYGISIKELVNTLNGNRDRYNVDDIKASQEFNPFSSLYKNLPI